MSYNYISEKIFLIFIMNYIIKLQLWIKIFFTTCITCIHANMPIDSHSSSEESNDEDYVYLYSFRTHFFIASSVWASEARWCEVIFVHGIPGSWTQHSLFRHHSVKQTQSVKVRPTLLFLVAYIYWSKMGLKYTECCCAGGVLPWRGGMTRV